jgi:hypothetical protein
MRKYKPHSIDLAEEAYAELRKFISLAKFLKSNKPDRTRNLRRLNIGAKIDSL